MTSIPELEMKHPIQILKGSFDSAKGQNRRFIPIPLRMRAADNRARLDLIDAAAEVAAEYHGTGVEIYKGEGSYSQYAILVEGGTRHFPFGNWILTYWYDDEQGTHGHEVYLAAELT